MSYLKSKIYKSLTIFYKKQKFTNPIEQICKKKNRVKNVLTVREVGLSSVQGIDVNLN